MSFLGPQRRRSDTPPSTRSSSTPDWRAGLGAVQLPTLLAPGLALAGLVIVAIVSINLLNGRLPTFGGGSNGGPNASGGGGPVRTPTPSNVVNIDPRTNVPGSILYVKAGNIWVQTGVSAKQLTNSDSGCPGGSTACYDSDPTWSPDGKTIYFVRKQPAEGSFVINGLRKVFDLSIPTLEQMSADGSNARGILTGRYAFGSSLWSYFIQQPSISPDGTTAAVISDGPNPTTSDIVLKLVDLASGSLTNPRVPEVGGLGQQDPAWSPDGKSIVYTKNARQGAKGAPTIVRYTLATKATKTLTGPGYVQPAWSPNSRYIAATRNDALGTNIVIIDTQTGAEVLRLTNDESSFAPEWSPAGDSILYLKNVGGVIDLWLVKLVGTGPNWTVGDSIAITESAGLDATSRESWFIPPDQIPTPPPAPSAAPSTAPASAQPS